jgi:hypothetical protein
MFDSQYCLPLILGTEFSLFLILYEMTRLFLQFLALDVV